MKIDPPLPWEDKGRRYRCEANSQRSSSLATRSNLTVEEMAQALVDVADESNKPTEAIAAIQKELQGLSPQNVNPQLEAIYKWMHDHLDYEQHIRRKLAREQLFWRIALTGGVVVAIALGLACLLR
jgi:hypothetical protein